MKMIAGTAYMVRADLLRQFGWGRSLTEDWELTLRLYARGYKVVYTPYAETPAECVSTFPRLARQRMRWAEGHSYNVRKWFWTILRSPFARPLEKLEFAFYAIYYLQALFFVVGTLSWLLAEIVLKVHVPQWTALLGWSLLFSNLLALPLMNLAGLLLEAAPRKDYAGILGAVILSYLLVPFQAWAALKGLLEREEGPWFRTPKTGRITDPVWPLRHLGWLRRWLRGPGKGGAKLAPAHIAATPPPRAPSRRLGWVLIGALTLALGGIGFGALHAPVVEAAGTSFYLHASKTMDTTSPTGTQQTFAMTTVNSARTWATSTATSASQTINSSTTFAFNYWTTGSAGATSTATLTFGYDSSSTCGAITQVQVGSVITGGTGAFTLTLPAASTAGDLLVATLSNNGAFTGGPAGWIRGPNVTGGATSQAEIWYYPNNPGGITSATFTSSSGNAAGQLSEWSGVASASPLDQTGTSSSATVTTIGATTQAGELAITTFTVNAKKGASTFTPGSGWTNLGNDGATTGIAYFYTSDYQLEPATGTVSETETFSQSSSNWGAVVATFVPANPMTVIAQATGVTLSNGSNLTTATFSPSTNVTVPAGSYFCWNITTTSVASGGVTLDYDASASPSNIQSSQTISIPELALPLMGLALIVPLVVRRRSLTFLSPLRGSLAFPSPLRGGRRRGSC